MRFRVAGTIVPALRRRGREDFLAGLVLLDGKKVGGLPSVLSGQREADAHADRTAWRQYLLEDEPGRPDLVGRKPHTCNCIEEAEARDHSQLGRGRRFQSRIRPTPNQGRRGNQVTVRRSPPHVVVVIPSFSGTRTCRSLHISSARFRRSSSVILGRSSRAGCTPSSQDSIGLPSITFWLICSTCFRVNGCRPGIYILDKHNTISSIGLINKRFDMSILSAPYFHNEDAAIAHLESIVWANGINCPKCGVIDEHYKIAGKTSPSRPPLLQGLP